MVWLPNSEISSMVCCHFVGILACDRQMDRQTVGCEDILQQYSLCYASCGKNALQKRQNSQLPWIPWIPYFRLRLPMTLCKLTSGSIFGHLGIFAPNFVPILPFSMEITAFLPRHMTPHDTTWRLRPHLMLVSSAALAVMWCPSVCPSVTFVHSVEMNKDIFKFFSPSGSHTSLVFPCQKSWRYSDGDPLTGRRMQVG